MLATCLAQAFPASGTTKLGELQILSAFFHMSATRFGCRWVMCAQLLSTLNQVVGLDDFLQRVDKDESFSPCFVTFQFSPCAVLVSSKPTPCTELPDPCIRHKIHTHHAQPLTALGVLFLLLFNLRHKIHTHHAQPLTALVYSSRCSLTN